MFRQLQLLHAFSPFITKKATFKDYYKLSDSMSQLESECEKCCATPFRRRQKVTVVGAGSNVGQMASLFLKQQNVIKTLALYDDVPEHRVLGVGVDLAHIDTSTEVEAYQGRAFLKDALMDADVVLICGSFGCCNELDRELFLKNMQLVRTTAIAITRFCPDAMVAIQTPPVDCNYALCAHTLRLSKAYEKRRVLGVNSVNAMRASQLYSALIGGDPAKINIPVVGGCTRCTRVPVFSAANPDPCYVTKEQLNDLTCLVREADDIIYRVKCNRTEGFLSIGFSTARFVLNVMKGLFEMPTFVDSALVEQNEPEKCYGLRYCATPVTVGHGGIVEYAVPLLNEYEQELLELSKYDLEDLLNLGRCYAVGDEYYPPRCKCCDCEPCQCPEEKSSKT